MKLATPEQMRSIDEFAINSLGIPGIALMENAAARVADEASGMLGGVKGKNILLAAGKGNNGGDAFAAARHLSGRGASVFVYTTARCSEISGDAGTNLGILQKIGLPVYELQESGNRSRFTEDISRANLIIDGIFGTGLKGEVTGLAKEIIEEVNRSLKPVLSIDIPSGISGGDGRVLGTCIKAARTVTFCLPKVGLVLHPGCDYAGELVTVDIGIPDAAVSSQNITNNVIDRDMVKSMIPKRYTDSNKGDYGKVLVISGSAGMTGSGCLCANAALRTGAGLVYAGVPSSLAPIYCAKLTEPVIIPLEDSGTGTLAKSSEHQLRGLMNRMGVIAAGPGLSVNEDIKEIIGMLVRESDAPLVLDADALNAVAADVSILGGKKAEVVITPHPGEMSRLTGKKTDEIQCCRLDTARDFAVKWSTVTVLKGSRTVAALPDGSVYINTTGNPGMATAGAGDVLTGIIAGLAGQGASLADAAIAGVYLHGMAGDEAARAKGLHGLLAGDIVDALPQVIREFEG